VKPHTFILRACFWSLLAYGLWEWLQPLSSLVVETVAHGILRLSGHPLDLEVKRANRGAVLFLALYLAQRRVGWESLRGAGIGVAACLVSEALAISTLAAVPAHQGVAERLVRSLAVGIDKATPLVAWLYLARREIFPWVTPGGLDAGLAGGRSRSRGSGGSGG
jgi:hypothetical protein